MASEPDFHYEAELENLEAMGTVFPSPLTRRIRRAHQLIQAVGWEGAQQLHAGAPFVGWEADALAVGLRYLEVQSG